MGLHHFISTAIIPLIIYWIFTWVIYTIVYSGLHLLLQNTASPAARKEYITTALAAATSLLIPAAILFLTNRELNLLIPVIISIISITTNLRQAKEHLQEKSHVIGDIIGYAFALATIALFQLL